MLTGLTGCAADVGMHALRGVDGECVPLLGDSASDAFEGQLFVREAGAQLLQLILEEHARCGQRCCVLAGSPATGTSFCAVNLTMTLLHAGQRVSALPAQRRAGWRVARAERGGPSAKGHTLRGCARYGLALAAVHVRGQLLLGCRGL
jgi:hypothetical protein